MTVAVLPALAVEADGAPVPIEALAHVRVHRRLSAPAMCELTFDGDVEGLPDVGAELHVALAADAAELFHGDVAAVEHVHAPDSGHSVLVRGYDRLHRLRRTQHVTGRAEATLGSIAEELAGAAGLTVEAPSGDVTWVRHLQLGETDLELLVLLAERIGAHLAVDEGVLRFPTLEGDGEPVATTLLEARVERSAVRAAGPVTVTGWNAGDAEAHVATAAGDEPEEVLLVGETVPDGEHARALAQGELDRRARHGATLWGVADGDPRLKPGGIADVTGLGPHADGPHVLTEVRHLLDERRGFVTELSTAPPEAHPRPRAPDATLGEVTSVDDPDGRGRVQVRLSAYGDVETDWLGVLVPGAGQDKGVVALPDVGDTVLVLLLPGGAGVVAGGLYGTIAPPDTGVEGGAVKRFSLRTPGGQIVTLDDAKTSVRIEDKTGSYLEMTPEKVLVHAAVDLSLEAPGRAVTVTGRTVDFRQG